jgi:transcriptional regulator with GAF, ATPase, and Fis domain
MSSPSWTNPGDMRGETIDLTYQESQRLLVLSALDRGELMMAEAATLLGRSVRHLRRLRRAYRVRGVATAWKNYRHLYTNICSLC